jgi:hypothetical protein
VGRTAIRFPTTGTTTRIRLRFGYGTANRRRRVARAPTSRRPCAVRVRGEPLPASGGVGRAGRQLRRRSAPGAVRRAHRSRRGPATTPRRRRAPRPVAARLVLTGTSTPVATWAAIRAGSTLAVRSMSSKP